MDFTQSDDLKLQRFQQAQGQAQEWLDDGEIDQQGFQDLMGQLQQRMQPLQQKQAQSEQQKKQQAMQEMQEQHAALQAMEQRAAEMRAQNFHKLAVSITHPKDPTKVAVFVPTGPGQWEQVQFPEDEPVEEADNG